jgi:predicted RNase H-like nuclease
VPAAILAIDAAWTATEPSGIALVAEEGDGWHCVALAPSYASFLDLAEGKDVPWNEDAIPVGPPDQVALLINTSRKLANRDVTLVTVDMPLATSPITGRRAADREVSRAFGCRGCATHSPNMERPGKVGTALYETFIAEGFTLATAPTAATLPTTSHHLVEVYPHPALLTLVDSTYRVEYKVLAEDNRTSAC